MENLYDILKFLHVMSFVFMSVPLFNLIVVNERALFGSPFNYYADRYMENIILHGAYRCFVFQTSVLITGLLLLIFGDLGIESLWTDWIIFLKTIGLFVLMAMLSYVHFSLQPNIEKIMENVSPESEIPEDIVAQLKPHRVRRKKMATFCLFLVITIIILGLQVYTSFDPIVTVALIILAGLFSWHVSKTLIRFGWV
jgi:uncharacterized membrane protein